MANYRDPKVTPVEKRSGIGRWLALAAAVVILAILIFWWLGGSNDEVVVAPVEPVPPAAEGTATEGTATGDTTTVPAEPAQQ